MNDLKQDLSLFELYLLQCEYNDHVDAIETAKFDVSEAERALRRFKSRNKERLSEIELDF